MSAAGPARAGLTGPAPSGDYGAAGPPSMVWPAHHPGLSPSRLPSSGSAPGPSPGPPSLPSPLPTLSTPPRITNNAEASAVAEVEAGAGLGAGAGGDAGGGLPGSLPLTGLTFEGVFSPTQVRMDAERRCRHCTCLDSWLHAVPWRYDRGLKLSSHLISSQSNGAWGFCGGGGRSA